MCLFGFLYVQRAVNDAKGIPIELQMTVKLMKAKITLMTLLRTDCINQMRLIQITSKMSKEKNHLRKEVILTFTDNAPINS